MLARRRRLEPADLGWQNSWQLNCAAIPELGSSYRSANRMLLAGGWRTTEGCAAGARGVLNAVARALAVYRMLWRGCPRPRNSVARDYAEGPQHLACRIAELIPRRIAGAIVSFPPRPRPSPHLPSSGAAATR